MTNDATESAWKIHAAMVDWTGKVDAKASFSLAIQSAILVAVLGLAGSGRRLSALSGVALYSLWIGVALLVVAVLCSTYTVRPRLRRLKVQAEASSNYIYFGHAMHWSPQALQTALESRDILPVLTRQIVVMSKIAWTKHRLVQISITASTAGIAALIVAAFLAGAK